MTPRIETIKTKKLIGKSIEMSLIDNKTYALFSGFMPFKKIIENTLSPDVYEVMLYNSIYFKKFSPTSSFTKWAALEVSDFDTIPEQMDSYILEGGLYAIFNYKGLAKDFGNLMRFILMEWLPNSEYELDSRAHFNMLGAKYIKDDPNSEEAVWIPIKLG